MSSKRFISIGLVCILTLGLTLVWQATALAQWSALPKNITQIAGGTGDFPKPFVFVDGSTLHVVYLRQNNFNTDLYYIKSTDAGTAFGSSVLVDSTVTKDFAPRVASFGSQIYVVYTKKVNVGGSLFEHIFFAKSTDGGATFPTIQDRTSGSSAHNDTPDLAVTPGMDDLWLVYRKSVNLAKFQRSTDGGANWTSEVTVTSCFSANIIADSLALAVNSPNVHVASSRKSSTSTARICYAKSTDSGANWTAQQLDATASSNHEARYIDISVSGNNIAVAYAKEVNSSTDIGVYLKESTNGGTSFGSTVTIEDTTTKGEDVPAVSYTSSGALLVAYQKDFTISAEENVRFVRRPSGGSFSTSCDLAGRYKDEEQPIFAVNGTTVYLVYQHITSPMLLKNTNDGQGSCPAGPGDETAIVFRPSTEQFLVDNNNDGTADQTITFGAFTSGDIAVVGDWDGDGDDNPGLYRPSTKTFYLDYDNDGTANATVSISCASCTSSDKPVVGDWDGDGDTNLGIWHEAATAVFHLDKNNDGTIDQTVTFGTTGDIPLAADFGGGSSSDYIDTVAVFRPSDAPPKFHIDYENDGVENTTISWSTAQECAYDSGDLPMAGDWDGDDDGNIGMFNASTKFCFDVNNNGTADDAVDKKVTFGTSGDQPLAGDFDSARNGGITPQFFLAPIVPAQAASVELKAFASGIQFIAINSSTQSIRVQIFDLRGQKVFDQTALSRTLNFYGLDDRGRRLANGVLLYIVSVRDPQGKLLRSEVRKLVLVR